MEELTANWWLNQTVNPAVFRCIEIGATEELAKFSQDELLPFLPILARSSLIQPDTSEGTDALMSHPSNTLMAISEIDRMNNIVHILSVDFLALEMDVKKEMQLRYVLKSTVCQLKIIYECMKD